MILGDSSGSTLIGRSSRCACVLNDLLDPCLVVFAGSEEACSEELGVFKRAVEEMQSVVDVHLVRLEEDEISKVRGEGPAETVLLFCCKPLRKCISKRKPGHWIAHLKGADFCTASNMHTGPAGLVCKC